VTTRRGRGEGGIRKRADGRWEAAIDLGWESGKRKRKFLYGRTRIEVAEKLRRVQAAIDNGRPVLDERVQVGDFLDRWLDTVVKPNRSHGHWRNCEAAVRLHIKPALGSIRLSKVTAADVQRLVNDARAKGLADDSVRLIHAALRAALGVAKRWGLAHENVASLVEPISVHRDEVEPFSEAELGQLLAVAGQDRLGAYVKVAVALGLRPGEARALTWADLDLDGEYPSLRVRNAFSRSAGGEKLGPPKTPRSRRVIALPRQSVDALMDHRRRQLKERIHAGPAWQAGDFVFAQPDGRPLTESALSRWFAGLSAQAGVTGHRLYDLRHTAATLLLAQGVHSRYLMEVLGHSTIRLTMETYAHVMPAAMRDTANAMDRALDLVTAATPGAVGSQVGGQTA